MPLQRFIFISMVLSYISPVFAVKTRRESRSTVVCEEVATSAESANKRRRVLAPVPKPSAQVSEEFFEIAHYVDYRMEDSGQFSVLVEWRGYPEEDEFTWEPLDRIISDLETSGVIRFPNTAVFIEHFNELNPGGDLEEYFYQYYLKWRLAKIVRAFDFGKR